MDIEKTLDGTTLTVTVSGRLNTNTAPKLEAELSQSIDGVQRLILDFGSLEYISSAGLRVVLSAQKKMNTQKGTMVVRNVNADILEVFEMTGFVDFLTIE